MSPEIIVRGARLHNLKNIDVAIPRDKLVVLTGVSGSGKSTLGFDILLKESQRQYLESLGMAPFGLARPPVDSITGLSPAVSVDQHLTNRSPRSTVGTVTDVYSYLRILFARLGHRPCPKCGKDVPPSFDAISGDWEGEQEAEDEAPEAAPTFPCPHCGGAIRQMGMASFSFNKPAGACPACTGLGTIQQANLERLVDEQKSIAEGAVLGWAAPFIKYQTGVLKAAAAHYGFKFDPRLPVGKQPRAFRDLLSYGVDSPAFRRHFPKAQPPPTAQKGRFEGVATGLLRRYAE
ncbi:MAG TPA: hypothetical protein VKP68_00430, partial [Ramlibacter sp.]|nr:hypothetical protein [Ramlibacter sp.]